MIIKELKAEIRQAEVFHRIDCYEDSELYEEVLEEYREIEEEMYGLCEPIALMEYGEVGPELAREGIPEGTPVLMVITSIGRGISEYSTKCFAEGDYLKGMLADAMADSALFSLTKEVVPYLKKECGARQMGISRRLEAPHDISMEAQKFIYEKTNARQQCGMKLSSGYMLDPVKSNSVLYVLSRDSELFMYQHNCRNCDRYDCEGRNIPDIPVKVRNIGNEYAIEVADGQSILDVLVNRDNSISAVCGGTGRCGKCKIKVLEGYLPVTAADQACLTEKELQEGIRLSCKAYPKEPLTISLLFQREASFEVLADYERNDYDTEEVPHGSVDEWGIAVDIGTTTVALQLFNVTTGKMAATHTFVNHQRVYGADVISRIKASVEGKGEELRDMIRRDLSKGIREVINKSQIDREKVKEVVIAANTTMIHLLMGYDCKGLGEFPFTPVNIAQITDSYINIMEDDFLPTAVVHILPGISTFVGGDIASGLYSLDMDLKKEYSLLIDLGTNGEIALGNRDKLLVTSTAAGPAFEGGNITYGVGSIEGAVCGVSIEESGINICTIGDKSPIGICGTGVIEAVSEILKAGFMDETGCLEEEYFDDGYPIAVTDEGEQIVISQNDIREIQLAKAAVRAGVETLFLRYGIGLEEVEHVYLAGGFGYKLDCRKAIAIGMLPACFADKIEAVGNRALGGAVKFLLEKKERARIDRIGSCAQEINLSADRDFNELYMDAMFFE